MPALLRLSPLVLAALVTGCTVDEYDRPYHADGSPMGPVAAAAAGMTDDLAPGQFMARIGDLPPAHHLEDEDEGTDLELSEETGLFSGSARMEATDDGQLVFLDGAGFAVRLAVMLPEDAFEDRVPDADADVPTASAPVAGGVGVEESSDVTAEAVAEEAVETLEGDGLIVLQTYGDQPRLRASVIVGDRRLDSQSGELHLRTVQDGRLRGWFYFAVSPLVTDDENAEGESVYGAFDALLTP